ncbi:MAG: glycosyltransferase family 4 protein [Candidatus Pacebacteria bacterium]|nr:glycosyltransferase family 4 protein [Candidatus Paceibacterota bacterium]
MDRKPRRVLIFSLVYYPRTIGGAEVAVKEITDRIDSSEVEFDMITLRKNAPAFERIGNVNVYRVGFPWFGTNTKSSTIFPLSKIVYIPLAGLKALSLHRKKKYDLTWPIMASYGGFAALIFMTFFPKVPMFLTIQEGDNFERRTGVLGIFFRAILKSADRIQAISTFLADWSRDMGATCPITVVPNGVDASVFSARISDGEASELKEKLGKKDGDIFLVTTSRLVPKNGIADIIDSLEFLPNNVKFLIIGSGQLEASLKSTVDSQKLGDRVMFAGFMQHAQMAKYVQISDIFIRPSLSEGLGNSFLEAMAAEIPVIATPVGGIPDFLVDGETGLFCDVNNPQSIAQKVEKLMKDRESRDYMVRNAKKMVEEKYGWEGIAKGMKGLMLEA